MPSAMHTYGYRPIHPTIRPVASLTIDIRGSRLDLATSSDARCCRLLKPSADTPLPTPVACPNCESGTGLATAVGVRVPAARGSFLDVDRSSRLEERVSWACSRRWAFTRRFKSLRHTDTHTYSSYTTSTFNHKLSNTLCMSEWYTSSWAVTFGTVGKELGRLSRSTIAIYYYLAESGGDNPTPQGEGLSWPTHCIVGLHPVLHDQGSVTLVFNVLHWK